MANSSLVRTTRVMNTVREPGERRARSIALSMYQQLTEDELEAYADDRGILKYGHTSPYTSFHY